MLVLSLVFDDFVYYSFYLIEMSGYTQSILMYMLNVGSWHSMTVGEANFQHAIKI